VEATRREEHQVTNSIDVGGIIRRVFQIYVYQASVIMPAAVIVFLITGVLSTVLTQASRGLGLLAVVISLVGTSLFTGMVVELVGDIQDGRRDASVGQLLRAVTPVLGQLILVGFIAAVAEGIGLLLLVVPGLVLLTMWSVFAPVIVLENPGGLRALGRSRELVRGNGWQVFRVIFVLVVVPGIVAGGVALCDRSTGTGVGLLIRVVVDVLIVPLSSLAAAVLYFDLYTVASGTGAPSTGKDRAPG
jgi:hypothetical protein